MMDSKRSSILATELKMEQLREQKRYLNIKAPFNGIIDGIMMYEGDLALAGKPILSMSSGVKKLIFNYTPSSNIERGQKVFPLMVSLSVRSTSSRVWRRMGYLLQR